MSWSEDNALEKPSQRFLMGLRSQFIVQISRNERGKARKAQYLFLIDFTSPYQMPIQRACGPGSVAGLNPVTLSSESSNQLPCSGNGIFGQV